MRSFAIAESENVGNHCAVSYRICCQIGRCGSQLDERYRKLRWTSIRISTRDTTTSIRSSRSVEMNLTREIIKLPSRRLGKLEKKRESCVSTGRRLACVQIDQMNLELTFAVCFNLGYQYHANGLQQEALSTYSQIIKNKQDAAQSYEAVIEAKVDHQACYNLIVCYYILGHVEKIKTIFTKMLLVRHYDSDEDVDDIDGDHSAILRNDQLRVELRSRQNKAFKYILTTARLVSPILGSTFVEGYDALIDTLKDQQYTALANELEMDKAVQHLRRQDFVQAISLLKNFERKEKDLKARAATNLSFLYFLEGDNANAEKHAELAVKTNCYNPYALVNHGNCLYSRGDIEGALVRYREAVEVEADCVEAIYNIGLSQKKLNSHVDALCTFKKLTNLLPNNVEVLFQIGHVYELMGNYQQAIKWLEIVNTRVMHDAGVLALLGSLYARLNDEPKALHYYSESHRVYPVNMDIISWLGAFYVKNEVYEKAMPYFELASKIQPAEVKWQLMVASCYRRTGLYKLALAKYRAILLQHPDNVECLRYLVHMCTSLGRKEELVHYETRLRQAETVPRIMTGEQRSQSRTEQILESRGSYSYNPLFEMSSRSSQDGQIGGENAHLFPELLPSSRSLCVGYNLQPISPPPQTPALRMFSAKKSKTDEEDWPELGDDLLPL